jgi:eukaryotic-like serine/threonine-protein kinase
MPPALRSGDSISRFRIVAPLGAGGMGEVYKAIDDSLDRPIALKVLPPELTRSEERLRRFVQEARTASSLSHPNIVHIYEIGTAAAVKGGGTPADDATPLHFIAMELIDGLTLKREIHEERTDLRALTGYLGQAADGLAKAHGAGVVHRDLKPENIMITRDGFAKVLDFGLAKLTEKRESGGETNAATAVKERTREGAVMGTVGYMSPEQVQGKSVDYRSDIFSFGCILYEAATRRKPFDADSDVDVMHKILHDKPQAVDELNPNVPAELRRIIRRCLAKEPDKRYQSMKDVAIELSETVDEWDALSASTTSASGTSSGATQPAVPRRRWLVPAIVGLALVLVAAMAFRIYREPKGGARPTGFSSMKIAPVTRSGDVRTAALSPDRKYVAIVRRGADGFSIWVRQVATGSDVRVVAPSPLEVIHMAFSPDGDYLFFVRREDVVVLYSTLFQVPVLGGALKKIIFDIDSQVGFSPDGRHIAFIRGNPPAGESYLMIAGVDGSGEKKFVISKGQERFLNCGPQWSPDGKQIAAFMSAASGPRGHLVLVDAASGHLTRLGSAEFWFPDDLAWPPSGDRLLVVGGDGARANQYGQVWAVSVPSGELTRVTNDLNAYRGVSLTRDGTMLATTQQRSTSNLWSWAPGSREAKQITSSSSSFVADLTSSGSKLYFVQGAVAAGPEIWTANLDGSGESSLVSTKEDPVWAPSVPSDDSFVLFQSLSGGSARVWRAERDGSNPRPLTSSLANMEFAMAVAPDGDFFVYLPQDSSDLMKVPLRSEGKPLVIGAHSNGDPRVSPDSRLIAATFWARDASGRDERKILVIPATGGSPAAEFPFRGKGYRWTPDGKALTYIRDDQDVSNLWRQPLGGSPPEQITHFKSGKIVSHTWTPTGTVMMGRGEETSDAVLITDFH